MTKVILLYFLSTAGSAGSQILTKLKFKLKNNKLGVCGVKGGISCQSCQKTQGGPVKSFQFVIYKNEGKLLPH